MSQSTTALHKKRSLPTRYPLGCTKAFTAAQKRLRRLSFCAKPSTTPDLAALRAQNQSPLDTQAATGGEAGGEGVMHCRYAGTPIDRRSTPALLTLRAVGGRLGGYRHHWCMRRFKRDWPWAQWWVWWQWHRERSDS